MTSPVETSSSAIRAEKGTVDVNGTCLYYELAGSGHPLVLVHGFSLDTRMWDDQFETFAQHYRVMRYDCRGYGKSALPTDDNYTDADDLICEALVHSRLGVYTL